MARFARTWDTGLLLAVMDEVLRAADADRPDRVTQAAYNATREQVGLGVTPRADKLVALRGSLGQAHLDPHQR